MRVNFIATLVVILGLATSTKAQEKELSPEFRTCLDKAVTNPEFAECSGAEIKRQEALLTTAWARVSSRMKRFDEVSLTGDHSHAALLKEQRSWIVYKDASCRYFDNREAFGREGEVIHFGVCRVGVLMQRVKELNDLIEFLKPR